MSELALRAPAFRTRARTLTWALGWWAGGRLLVLATAAVVDAVGPRGYTGGDERGHALGLLGAWDGRWYRTVAEHGYLLEPGRQSDPAFFPLFPLLLRAAHALGLGWVAGGILLANLSFLAALVLFAELTRGLFDEAFARRAVMLLAVFPAGAAFSLAYPESLVLALIAGGVVAARRDRWLLAAALLAAGTLARPETAFATIPLVPLARRSRRGVAWGAVAAPFAALGSFALYLGATLHDPLAWTHAERAWGRRFTPLGLARAIAGVPQAFASNAWVVRDIAYFALYLALLALAYRAGAPLAWIAAGALIVVLPTFSGSFHSINRFGLLAPAVFWGLAALPRPRVVAAVAGCLLVVTVATLPLMFP